MSSTGNIASDSIDWANELPELYSGLDLANPFLGTLPFAEAANVCCCRFQGVAKVRRYLLPCSVDFFLAHTKVLGFEAVELARITQQGRVAALAYILHDLGCGFFGTCDIASSAIG